jgi:hypothetical protein
MIQQMTGNQHRFLATIIAFFGTLILFIPFARLGIDPHHDGIMLKPALDVMSGQMVYRDTFTQYGALATLIQASWLKLFGAKLIVLRFGTVAAYAAAIAILVQFWWQFLPLPMIWASLFLWWGLAPYYEPSWTLMPWSSVIALVFQASTLYFLFTSFDLKGRWLRLIAAGVFASLTFWTRQPVGGLLFGAGGFAPLLMGWQEYQKEKKLIPASKHTLIYLLLYGLGFGLISLAVLSWLSMYGALGEWYMQNFVWPRKWAQGSFHVTTLLSQLLGNGSLVWSHVWLLAGLVTLLPRARSVINKIGSRPLRLLLQALPWIGYILWIYRKRDTFAILMPLYVGIPLSVLLVFCFSILRRRVWELSLPLFAVLPALLVSWLQFFPVPCLRHMYWAVAPIIGVFSAIVLVFFKRDARMVALGLVLVALPSIAYRVPGAIEHLKMGVPQLSEPPILQGIRPYKVDQRQTDIYVSFYKKLRDQYPGRAVLLEGPDALFAAFAEDLRNAGPFYVVWHDLGNPDRDIQRMKLIDDKKPVIVAEEEPRFEIATKALSMGYSKEPREGFMRDISFYWPPSNPSISQ